MSEYKFLLLEDSKTDAEFMQHYLNKDNIRFVLLRVETREAFTRAIRDFGPDLILSDYNLPAYDGLTALEYVQENCPQIPVIMVSGAIGDEKAVDLLHHGAKDYVLKEKLERLPGVVRRVLREAGEIRARKEAEKKLAENEARYRILVENSPLCIHEIDLEGRLLSMNPAGLEMVSKKNESEVIGISYLDWVNPDERGEIGKLLDNARQGTASHFEFTSTGKNPKYFKSCFVPIKNQAGNVIRIMGITEDITQRKIHEIALKESENNLRQIADFDPLTGLPNRRLLHDRLKQVMRSATRNAQYGVIMFIDLDNFKPLNDLHGHSAGDILLTQVAERINGTLRQSDTVSRYGGDEFIVMLSDLDLEASKSLKKAGTVAEKIRQRLAEPYIIELHPNTPENLTIVHNLTASIGVTIFGPGSTNYEEVLKWADHAMYRAKSEGRNRIRFYNKEYIDE